MKRIILIALFLLSFSIMAQAAESVTYFPKGLLDPESSVKDGFKTKRYSKFLTAMEEPSLWELSKSSSKNEIYRFLLLRFSDDPVCIRVEISESGAVTVYTKTTSGKGGSQPGDLEKNETKNISTNDIQPFLTQIASSKFWDMLVSDFVSYDSTVSRTESSKWIFEGVNGTHYQLIEVGSPTSNAEDEIILTLGKAFLSLSGLVVDPLY